MEPDAIELLRGGSKAAEKRARDEALKGQIVRTTTGNPAYGYRRMNHKRLRRLLN